MYYELMKYCKGDCKKQYANSILNQNDGYCKNCYDEKLKTEMWKDYNGESQTGKCYACSDFITIKNYHTGYIISLSNGGKHTPSNIRPICLGCKIKSNGQNLNDYSKSIKRYNMPVPMDVEPPSFYLE